MKITAQLFCRLSILALIGCGASWAEPQPSAGRTLYKWTDTEGGVHFSDQIPAGEVGDLKSQPLPAIAPAAQDARDDRYSVENQARLLEKERQAREEVREQARKERDERKLRKLEIEAARAKKEAAERPREIYIPGYPWPGHPVPPVHPMPPPEPPIPPEPVPDRPKMKLPRGITH